MDIPSPRGRRDSSPSSSRSYGRTGGQGPSPPAWFDFQTALDRMPTPPPRSPDTSVATNRRSSTMASSPEYSGRDRHRVSLQAKTRTLSEELGGIDHPFDKFDSPRSSISGVSGSSNATLTARRRGPGEAGKKRRSRTSLSASSSATTLFISMASPQPPLDEDDVFSARGSEASSLRMARTPSQFSMVEEPIEQPPRESPKTTRRRSVIDTVPTPPEVIKPPLPAHRRALASTVKFLSDLFTALQRILFEVAWPLLGSLLGLPLTLLPRVETGRDDSPPTEKQADSTNGTRHFAERFKYIICTSYLLTPSLSISLYDSPPEDSVKSQETPASDAAKDDSAEIKKLARAMPDWKQSTSVLVASHADLTGSAPSSHSRSTTLPPLVGMPRNIRNATAWALALLVFASASWDAWFRTSLLVTTLSWSLIVAHTGITGGPSTLSFTLRVPRCSAQDVDDTVAIVRRRKTQGTLTACASQLVESSQQADKAFNKALSAIQEVELVARGFKISHPLPPISRIEAATSSLNASPHKSKFATEAHSGDPFSNTNGKISRSASAASSDSNTKHGELQHNNDKETPRSTSTVELRRMAHLRRKLRSSLDEARQLCRSVVDDLSSLVDADELSALRDMYSLDGDGHATTQGLSAHAMADSRGASPLFASPSMGNLGSADDSFVSMSSMQKHSSWGLSGPRSAGANVPLLKRSGPHGSLETSFDESFASPRANGNGHKRFSLTASENSVTSAAATLSRNGSVLKNKLSRKDSTGSDAGGGSGSEASTPRSALPAAEGAAPKPKGSRLSYIAEGSNINGPNTSPAAKRMSYQSLESRPGSQLSQNKRDSLDAIAKTQGSPVPSWTSSLKRAGGPRGIGGLSGFALGAGAAEQHANTDEPYDLHTLLGLKHAFEQLHVVRRRALCHLLALDLTTSPLQPEGKMYWDKVIVTMERFCTQVDRLKTRMTDILSTEMSGDYWEHRLHDDEAREKGADGATSSRIQNLFNVPGSTGLVPFSGFEDKSQALAMAIRSIQVKLRACAEELQMGVPNSLHGIQAETTSKKSQALSETDVVARKESAERIWDSLKEDIISLSQEWETGSKILRAEKRRGAAVGPGSPKLPSDRASPELQRSESANGVLESPLEAEEDALGRTRPERDNGPAVLGDASETLTDNLDLTALLLSTTSPAHLPPPGLEQVYESLTNNFGATPDDAGAKLTREERIARVKQQRQEALLQQQKSGGTHAHAGVVSELKGVLEVLRAQKQPRNGAGEQQRQTQSATTADLGSPFDASTTGAFNGPRPAFSNGLHSHGVQHPDLAAALASRRGQQVDDVHDEREGSSTDTEGSVAGGVAY